MEEKRKKIIYIITLSHYGGAQKYLHILAKNMKNKGNDVSFAIGAGGPFINFLKEDSIGVHEIPSLIRKISPINDIKATIHLIKILRKEKPDIVHITSSKTGLLGTIAARIAGIKKIVFCIQGLPFIDTGSWSPLSRLWMRFSFFVTFILSHKIISVSKLMSNHVINWPTVSKKISLAYNSVAEPNFISKDEARKFFESKINQSLLNKTIVGSLAELRNNKGINYLVDAAAKLVEENKNILFIICGEGDQRENLEKQISDLGLEENFFLLGHVDNASKYLKGFDIFILPSLTEALSLAILEVGHAGLPTIATAVAGTPEMIINDETGILIQPENSAEIETAIQQYIKNPKLMDLYAKNLKNHIKNNFSVDSMNQKTIAVYDD